MSIKVNDSKDPVAEQDSLLVQVDYANQPIPNNRLPKGLYYSFKDKWVDMITLLTPAIKKIVTANTTVPAWGSITGTLSNQTDLQSALDNKMSSDLTDSHIFVGDATNKATDVAMTGDVTIDNTGATTLANTAVTAGTYGNSTNVPQIVVDSKGRIIGASNVAISGASVTPSALTKTDDTNVTLTLGGTPSTALLQAVSLTLGWAGTLADSRIASASTWNNKQNALGYTPEDVANKATSLTSPDNTKYPTTQAVQTALDLKTNLTQVQCILSKMPSEVTLTTLSGEQILYTHYIPANTLSAKDLLIIRNVFNKSTSTGITNLKMRVTENAVPGSFISTQVLASYSSAAAAKFIPFDRNRIFIKNNSTWLSIYTAISLLDDNSANNYQEISFNRTVDLYIHITAQNVVTTDVLILNSSVILKQ